jgi:predicted DNA-binding transcriptional regulator AlpA
MTNSNFINAQPDRILRTAEAAKKLPLSKTSFYELPKHDPTFPRAIALEECAHGYSERDLDAWLANRPRD